MVPSATAAQTLAKLRTRFTVAPSASAPLDDSEAARSWSPLLPGVAEKFAFVNGGLEPAASASVEAHPAHLLLPSRATGFFQVEDVDSGMLAEIRMRDLRDVPAESADGYLVYREAHVSGATVLHRALWTGTEDFVSFETRPAAPEVAYELRVRKLGGLRLVANTLEMLDDGGAPRLRVAPPYVMGSDGVRAEARLALEGCAADANPAAPWGRQVTAPGADTCTLRVSWSNDEVTYPALLDPAWTTTGSLAPARQAHTSTLLSTGKVLVVGGADASGAPLSSAQLFDPAMGTWAATAAITGARQLHSAVQLNTSSNATTSGKVLVAGGKGSSTLNTAQLYSATAGTWVAATNLNVAREQASATLLANGRVLFAGGVSGMGTISSAAVYDPTTGGGTWTATGTMGTARKAHTATLLSTTNATLNNNVLVVGGDNGSASTTTAPIQRFDGTSWFTLTPPTGWTAREGQTATRLANGNVLIAGGKTVISSTNTTILGSAWLFNPTTGSGTWTQTGAMNVLRQQHTATLLSSTILNNGQVLVVGGSNTTTATLPSAELFNGSTWALTSSLTATKAHTANLLPSGFVLIAGGLSGSTPVGTAQLYDPSRALACTTNAQCATGFCSDGVCCNTACNNGDTTACVACNLAGSIGTCSSKPSNTACTTDNNPCTVDRCNATGSCTHTTFAPSTTQCRGAADACDTAAFCTGTSATCPANGFKPNTFVCRQAVGGCDVEEKCTGSSAACPTNAFKSPGTACTDDGNPCTLDQCDAVGGCTQHPAGNAGVVCRPAAPGGCDVAETCTGTSTTCPTDGFAPATTQCRASADACDTAAFCPGTSATCPANGFKPNTAVCRPAVGVCDIDEKCTGTSAACPANSFKSAGTACTDDGNPCTLDQCDAVGGCTQHPAGNAGTLCRAAVPGGCDVAETCNGTSTTCPTDRFAPSTTSCRPSAGPCDVAENCTGSSAACPADATRPDGVSCSSGNACLTGETCQAGSCSGGSLVTCSARDTCHDPGSCDTSTGVCSNPAKPPPCTAATLTVDSASAHVVGGGATATWALVSAPQRDDFVGLYPSPTTANFQYLNFVYTCASRAGAPQGACPNGTPNGSAALAIPLDATLGSTYELRYVSGTTGETIATSTAFAVNTCTNPGVDCAKVDVGASIARQGGGIPVTWSGLKAARPQDILAVYVCLLTNGICDNPDRWAPKTTIYTQGAASGSVNLNIPTDLPLGDYQVIIAADSYAPIAKSGRFAVAPCARPTDCAQISVTPTSPVAGGWVSVTWSGEAGPGPYDFVGLYPVGAPMSGFKNMHTTGALAGGTMGLAIPVDTVPGTYELRLAANAPGALNYLLLATTPPSSSFTINARPANGAGSAKLDITPTAPYPGGGISVRWSDVGAAKPGDFLGIYAQGDGKYQQKTLVPINGQTNGTLSMSIPQDLPPGITYDVRLSAEDSYEPVAIAPLSVSSCPTGGCATVSVGQPVAAAGRTVSVSWDSEAAPSTDDFIGIYAVGASLYPFQPFFQMTGGTASGTKTLTLPANLAPGKYEARLVYRGPFYVTIATSSPSFDVQADCNTVGCPPSDPECQNSGTCNTSSGICTISPKANGTACGVETICTHAGQCSGGSCVALPVLCGGECTAQGACDPARGGCAYLNQPDGFACNDHDSCTRTDTCQGGACVGDNVDPIACPPAPINSTTLSSTVRPTETDAPGLTEGATPATFSVTPDGAASYVMKLWAPPGRGVQPNLSLVYGSRFGAGIFGVGWQLTGLSQITRCPRTIGQDEEAGPVDFGPDGPFCLDGRKLVHFGVNEFRPENDKFTKITTDDARSKFTVFQRDGRVLVFGGSSASQLFGTRHVWNDSTHSFDDLPNPSAPQAQVYAWALSSVSDRVGNSMQLAYRTLSSGPSQRFTELLPTTITYSPGRSIVIKYDDEVIQRDVINNTLTEVHPSPSYRFVTGLGLASTRVVTNVTMFGPNPVNNGKLREYKLNYTMHASLTDRSLLRSVQECDGQGVCLTPTVFDWDEGDGRFEDIPLDNAATSSAFGGVGRGAVALVALDLDQDGRDDIYFRRKNGTGQLIGWRFGTANGFTSETPDTLAASVGIRSIANLLPVDIFAEGRMELDANLTATTAQFYKFNGQGFDVVAQFDTGISSSPPVFIADLNGDGLPDLLRGADTEASWFYHFNQGQGQFSAATALQQMNNVFVPVGGTPIRITYAFKAFTDSYVGDFDGSGRNALFIAEKGSTEELGGDGNPLGPPVPFDNPRYRVISARTHQVSLGGTTTEILGKSTSLPLGDTRQAGSGPLPTGSTAFHYYLVDINGDGTADAIQVPNSGGVPSVAFNNGTNFEPLHGVAQIGMRMVGVWVPQPGITPAIVPGVQVGDWNEDGVPDVILLGGHATETGQTPPGNRTSVGAYVSTRYPDFPFREVTLKNTNGQDIPAGDFLDPIIGQPTAGYPISLVLDSDGNGLMDFIQPVGGQLHLYRHLGKKADQIIGIKEGQGKKYSINYESMQQEVAGFPNEPFHHPVYERGTCSYPEYCITRGLWLVAGFTVTTDAAAGDVQRTRQMTYRYQDARSDLTGRGFVAMGSRSVIDGQTGTVVTTVYDNALTDFHLGYPKAALPKAEIVATPLTPITASTVDTSWHVTSTTNEYEVTFEGSPSATPPERPYNVRPKKTQRTVFEIKVPPGYVGAPGVVDLPAIPGAGSPTQLSQTTTDFTSYDAFNNLTESTTTSAEEVRIYRGSYLNQTGDDIDPTTFILGMQTRSEVTSTTQIGANQKSTMRVVTYSPNPRTGLVDSMTIQGDTAITEETQTVTYFRNTFGQVTATRVGAADPFNPGNTLFRTVSAGYDDGDGVFPSSQTNAMGQKTQMLYHPGLGVLAFETDPNGVHTALQYDGFGRLRTRTTDGQGAFTVSYHNPGVAADHVFPPGLVITTDQAGGGHQFIRYNALGHPTAVQTRTSEPTDSIVDVRYTGLLDGQVESVSRPYIVPLIASLFTTYQYDPLGRVTLQVFPDNSRAVFSYTGLTQSVTDPKGNVKKTRLDSLGRPAEVTEVLQHDQVPDEHTVLTNYTYGPFSTVSHVDVIHGANSINGSSTTLLRSSTMTYDDLGRRKYLFDPEAGESTRIYNAFGEIVQEQVGTSSDVESESEVDFITYGRDALGRVISESSLFDGTSTFTWDTARYGIGRIASSRSFDGVERRYTYDSTSRLKQERWTIDQPSPYVVDYGYDGFGRLATVRYPTVPGRAARFGVGYHYDATGIADAVCNRDTALDTAVLFPCDPAQETSLWHATARAADGQLRTEVFANGEITTRQYADPRGFLTNIDTAIGATKNQSASYDYDPAGNLQTRTESRRTNGQVRLVTVETFDYDAINRLKSVTNPDGSTTAYSYDDTGNFNSRTITSAAGGTLSSLNYSFTASSSPIGHPNLIVNDTTYTFDSKGRNTLSSIGNAAQRQIAYTAFDLPKTIQDQGGSQNFSFTYDAHHRRASKTSPTGTTAYVGDLYERHNRDADGLLRHLFYIRGAERIVAEVEVREDGVENTYYLHDDHLGSIATISGQDPLGPPSQFVYDAFGTRSSQSGNIAHLGFTSHEQDDDITAQFPDDPGLVNMKGRMYDPKIGRFMTADPIVSAPLFSQGLNRYAYVLNNPLGYIDPTGFEEQGPGYSGPLGPGETRVGQGTDAGGRTSTTTWTAGDYMTYSPGGGGPTAADAAAAYASARQAAGAGGPPSGGGAYGYVAGSDGPRLVPMGGGGPGVGGPGAAAGGPFGGIIGGPGTPSLATSGGGGPSGVDSRGGPGGTGGYSVPMSWVERHILHNPSRDGGYWGRVINDWHAANRTIPGLMAPPGLGAALGASGGVGAALGLPTPGAVLGGAANGALIIGGAADAAGGGFVAVFGAGTAGAGMGITAVGAGGVAGVSAWGVVGGAAVVGAGATLVVGMAYEGGLFVGSMITGAFH